MLIKYIKHFSAKKNVLILYYTRDLKVWEGGKTASLPCLKSTTDIQLT